MHTTILAAFLQISRTVVSMCSAGILLFLVALWVKNRIMSFFALLVLLLALSPASPAGERHPEIQAALNALQNLCYRQVAQGADSDVDHIRH